MPCFQVINHPIDDWTNPVDAAKRPKSQDEEGDHDGGSDNGAKAGPHSRNESLAEATLVLVPFLEQVILHAHLFGQGRDEFF